MGAMIEPQRETKDLRAALIDTGAGLPGDPVEYKLLSECLPPGVTDRLYALADTEDDADGRSYADGFPRLTDGGSAP